ncbi:MAG TPA: hypothetical protein VNW24_06160 [Stellaceae bacterium]|jgi:hypothetical protein|nr:hypothetical protein [Stellaceae bacterium]
MEVEDLSGTHSVHSIAQLEQLLGVRFKDQENEFWLRADKSDHPALSIMVKGDLAAIHYFPKEGHAGHVSIGGKMNLDAKKMTKFSIGSLDPGATIHVPNHLIVSFSEALEVAKEFFRSQELPRSIEWFEL